MTTFVARSRRPVLFCLVVVALLLAGALRPDAGANAGPEQQPIEITMALEEDGASAFIELSRTNLIMAERCSMIRFIPWRRVSKAGVEGKVRMGLGYGIGNAAPAEPGTGQREEGAVRLFDSASNWSERIHFQLDAKQLEDLIRVLDTLEKAQFSAPPAHVKWRVIDLTWGDLALRKADDGYFILIPGDPGGYEPLPVQRFRAVLERARAELKKLMDAPPSATW